MQVYATIAGEPVVFHLTSTESLQQVAYAAGVTRNTAALVVAVVMLPLAQVPAAPQHVTVCIRSLLRSALAGAVWCLRRPAHAGGVRAGGKLCCPQQSACLHARMLPGSCRGRRVGSGHAVAVPR